MRKEGGHIMFRIAICDDESTICSLLENIIWECGKTIQAKIDIDVFYSGEKLYSEISSGSTYDMIFLDIELQLINGIEIGKRIREELKNEVIQIVYISAKESYAMDLFEIRPMHFLIKPLKEEKVKAVIKKGMDLTNRLREVFQYKVGRRTCRIEVRNILYFESHDRQVRMVTINGEETFYSTLKDVYEQVEKYNFIMCHKSYLINYNHVIAFEYDRLTMANKVMIPISQPQRKFVREYQIKFEKDML